MKKRSLTLILAMLMAASAFTLYSCGENDVNNDTETESGQTPAGEETVETDASGEEVFDPTAARMAIDDELPDTKFDGRTFRVLTNDTFAGYDYIDEIWVEELTGDKCNDAIHKRNERIEERFEVEIECSVNGAPHDEMTNIVTADIQDYQVVGFQSWYINIPITNGYLYNWLDTPYIDPDKPWHNKLSNEGSTINGILYGICSDLSISSMTYTHAIYVNTKLLADFGHSLDELYSTVQEGKWTMDTLDTMVEGMWQDYNGDGLHDIDDIHGFGYDIRNPGDVWFTAFGGKFYDYNDETSEFTLTFMDEKTVDMYDKLYNFHYNNPGYIQYTTQYNEEIYFLNEKLVMAPMRFLAAFNSLYEMESAYAMIPYPKYDEAQDAYYTNADDKFSLFGIPKNVANDGEFISVIYEALAAESYKTVYPVYYDEALKGRYSSDPTTSEMVDLIMDGRAFDFSFQFSDVFKRLPYFFRDNLLEATQNISGKYRSIEKVALKSIEKVLYDAYEID